MRRMLTAAVALAGVLATAAFAEEAPSDPSIKEGFKQIGRDVADTSKQVYDKAKNATMHGVGTALEKTGEGFDKAAGGLDHAGEKVKQAGGGAE